MIQRGDTMAKDDYHVIVYQILSYLYQRLKKGEAVDGNMLLHDSPLFQINKKYWAYIIYHLHESGFVEGAVFVDLDGLDVPMAAKLQNMRITPAGIEYLCNNTTIEKVKSFLKDIKEIIPFT